jgi:hypothetical protein
MTSFRKFGEIECGTKMGVVTALLRSQIKRSNVTESDSLRRKQSPKVACPPQWDGRYPCQRVRVERMV